MTHKPKLYLFKGVNPFGPTPYIHLWYTGEEEEPGSFPQKKSRLKPWTTPIWGSEFNPHSVAILEIKSSAN